MREYRNINAGWNFTGPGGGTEAVDVPHTWNGRDGQDGGNDYRRGMCLYEKHFSRPENLGTQQVYLEFCGVNASAKVTLNGQAVCSHDGGYSTFRAEITELLQEENHLKVEVDNGINDRVYPQKADFTFYGGIYRDVSLLIVNREHFQLDYFGGNGLKLTPVVKNASADVEVEIFTDSVCEITVTIYDGAEQIVGTGKGKHSVIPLKNPHLWNGVKDPYLYRAEAAIWKDGVKQDEVSSQFGVRSFSVDPETGFFLNGRSYPLHGVGKHQDWKELGNAITKANMDKDMELIREIGANTIRLTHYQHDQYFYDLCDRSGMIVWAEIPYISSHMPEGRGNTISQMKELIIQNYNHPSIVCWGISNEITISTRNHKDMMDNHRELNELCHKLDATRLTTLACYAMCLPFDSVVHKVSDLVSYNLYLGWYVPGLWLNDLFLSLFHRIWKKRCIGYSEYGAEGMPNLHSSKPRRGDHTEEYQAVYHEYMLKCFERYPFLWATHVWNMFDFAADARDQGGEPGMNHKGLVTFDRKIKKDSFYLYKAWWSEDPFVYICGRRYQNRTENAACIKVYSNQMQVSLYQNDRLIEKKEGRHVFEFSLILENENRIRAVSGASTDEIVLRKVDKPDPSYVLREEKHGKSQNWV